MIYTNCQHVVIQDKLVIMNINIKDYKEILYITIPFFLIVNTSYFWEQDLGFFAMLSFLIKVLYSLIITVVLILQLVKAIKEKFEIRSRTIKLVILSFVLTSFYLFPRGIIDFEQFESENLLVAKYDGTACGTTLFFKADNTFKERNVCFGLTEIVGNYRFKNDTIFFESVDLGRNEDEYYKFAVIKKDENDGLGELIRFKSLSSSKGNSLYIKKMS